MRTTALRADGRAGVESGLGAGRYALLSPEAATRIRTQLAPVLNRPEARTGLLTVCAQVLQAQDRTDFYAQLASPAREPLTHL
ncbi:hypothetical protein OG842_43150 (plasmid) [Streptomyces sp. NBC_00376]|uniref:hypothetical protein n=1 Tax=unclassified Streptomyces TaxID=2593676 RepID=UPI002E1AAEAF